MKKVYPKQSYNNQRLRIYKINWIRAFLNTMKHKHKTQISSIK